MRLQFCFYLHFQSRQFRFRCKLLVLKRGPYLKRIYIFVDVYDRIGILSRYGTTFTVAHALLEYSVLPIVGNDWCGPLRQPGIHGVLLQNLFNLCLCNLTSF